MGNVFNRYGAGGGKSEGLYIWKKSEYIPSKDIVNPTMNVTVETTNLYINSASFDYSGFPTIADYVDGSSADSIFLRDFLSGFSDSENSFSVSSDSLYFLKGTTMYKCRNAKPSTNGRYYVMLNSNTYLDSTTTFTYNGTKTIPAKIGDMVGYVVSDKETDYPDKEAKDGYYYEKVKYDSSMFGGDKVVTGTITPTSNARSISISNTVGTIPKLLMIESANQSSYFNYGLWIFDNTGVNGVTGYCSGGTGYSSSASGTANATTITPMVKNTSSNYFQANTKLAYVVVY